MFRRTASWACLAAAIGPTVAQFDAWKNGQISTEICTWKQPRAIMIRDMVYLDGGDIKWTAYMNDGKTITGLDTGNNEGIILNFNLSTPFNTTTNVTKILLDKPAMSKARGGSGNSNGAAPNFIDGALLGNDAEFFLYGGDLLQNNDLYQAPDKDKVLGYQAYQYGPDKPTWRPSFVDGKLSKGVTRYVAYGGAANVPSENLAFYFSGLRSPSQGAFFTNDPKNRATNVSNTLITLNMEEQLYETWTNTTLKNVKGRSNAEVVWVPVGKKGVLVVLGGVVYPEWAGRSGKSANESESEKQSPEFMQTIDIYDIESKSWYQQETKDGPGTRTRGCAVVATASDRSSFNIFYYGGFDGIHPLESFSDDVWVLSLPSFTWIKINEGKSLHSRAGHKCFMPYPDQMLVFGGYTSLAGNSISCLDKGPIVNFNVTSGQWLEGYDPDEYGDYGVHEKIHSEIGGNAAGGATATAPADGWSTSALKDIFDTKYDMKKIRDYWPYNKAVSTGRPRLDSGGDSSDDNNKSGGGSGLPNWVAPVLGVVLGLMFVTGALVIFCLWRRRKIFKNRSSDDGTEDPGSRIRSWIRGQHNEKAPTVTTDETPTSPGTEVASTTRFVGLSPSPAVDTPVSPASPAEVADTQIHEMADTSRPPELHDTGLSPIEIIQKHSHFANDRKPRSMSNPSSNSNSIGGEHASTVSRSTGPLVSQPESPTAGHTRMTSGVSDVTESDGRAPRVTSDVSGVSEGDTSALRHYTSPISPKTDDGNMPSPPPPGMTEAILPSPPADPTPTSPLDDGPVSPAPISPPSANEAPGQDYITAKASASPIRKSMFKESDEDMGHPK
ncbi:hypothetical protein F53441_6031 [Fusarium austroafricanum]|uniref:Kelch repeat protein n=1 Tax=Fusarium austroafricanum TaxID=2364996 RepID=A0A8H4KGQ0_9HYPO|nr:hypothetical protein F53441_6031 [Fusarium austroafricanum]